VARADTAPTPVTGIGEDPREFRFERPELDDACPNPDVLAWRAMWSHGRITIPGSVCALLLIGACGGAAPPGAKGSGEGSDGEQHESSAAPCAQERARAVALAQAVEALGPPDVPPPGGKAESLAFMQGPLADWVRSRRAATHEADQALAAVLACTPSAEQSSWLLQRGRLQSHFATAFLRVGVAAMPTQFSADPPMKKLMVDSLVEAVTPQLERARSSFEACVALGSKAQASDVSACAAELRELPGSSNPAPQISSTGSTSGELKMPPHLAYPRPFVTTSQPKPCAFAGTLKLWRPTLKIGSREVARVEQVEVSRLSLPSARSGAFVVQTAWPIRGTFTLEASALPLNLRSRVELSGKHVWLSRGAAVSASEVGEGKALAYRPLGENAHVTPDPVAKVACSELELAGAAPPQAEDEKRSRVNFKGALPLSEAPGGRSIGNFTLREPEAFTLLERRSGWLHIRSSSTPIRDFGQRVPYDFEAWTQAHPTDETGWGMIGLLNEATPATHESIAELALFAAPYAREPIGKLVKGVPLLVGETRQGFVNVVVPGMDAAAVEASGFWAEKRAFDASVRAL